MKKRKNRRKTDKVVSANRSHRTRIMVILGVGFILILAEFLGLPMIVPKPITVPRVIHGSLISPPMETNAVTARSALPSQPIHAVPALTGPAPVFKAKSEPVETVNGYVPVGFDRLAGFQVFVYHRIVDPVRFTSVPYLSRPIPDSVKSLDNHEVAIIGFMLPLKLENGRVSEFLLMRSRSFCCFGIPLQLNEWVHVRMVGEGVKSIMDVPLTVYGTLHVGEIVKNGQMSSIYQMDGEKMEAPIYFQ